MGTDRREVCIQFHSKGECDGNYSISHAPLRGKLREDYIYFIGHCRAGYGMGDHMWKQNSGGGGGQNS